jgi:hypothetical protein
MKSVWGTMRRNNGLVALSLFGASSLLTGCGGTTDSAGNILLQDMHNYSATGILDIQTIETAPAADLDVCWTGIINDLQCHPVVPTTDLDNVSLLRFLHLSETEVEQRLSSGELAMSEVDGYVEYKTNHTDTCMKLSQLSFFGTAIKVQEEYVESTDRTYMLLFAKGTRPGVGARAMVFVKPTAASVNTRVDAPTGCGLLEFSADLSTAARLGMPSAAPWVIDWRNITKDGQGNKIEFQSIDGVMIGFYEGQTVAEIQANIFDLELRATTLWEIKMNGGRTADLSTATARGTGAPFPGFASATPGVWMLALTCSTCQNPAPVVLTVLDPGAGGL